jgi:hypothetical protein
VGRPKDKEITMRDRTIKLLLAAVVGLLAAILVRPAFEASAVRAQGPAAPPAGQVAITASDNLIYTLQGDRLSVFYVDLGVANPFELVRMLGDEKEQKELLKNAKLRLLLRQNLSQIPGDAATAR